MAMTLIAINKITSSKTALRLANKTKIYFNENLIFERSNLGRSLYDLITVFLYRRLLSPFSPSNIKKASDGKPLAFL